MRIKRLRMHQFRNYAHAEMCPHAGITVLTGDNGQGKTSVLEAIHLCCLGRSHRTPHDKELIRWGEHTAHVRIEAESNEGTQDIAVSLTDQERRGKTVRVGGSPVTRIGELMGHINGVFFGPEDLKLVKEGPSERRRFLDMELSQMRPRYFYALQRYTRALTQRNLLLRQLAAHGDPALRATLLTWDDVLARVGAELVQHRTQFIERLHVDAANMHSALSGGLEKLQLQYISPLYGVESAYDRFLQLLHRAQGEDLRRGTTTVGPHRDDVQMTLDGRDVRTFGSQGQQRTVALSMKLAELSVMRAEREEAPVLLLDDVMSELDPTRRKLLLGLMGDVQTLVTCTHIDDLADAKVGAVYEVKDGEVRQRG